jgi:hypothetical protein
MNIPIRKGDRVSDKDGLLNGTVDNIINDVALVNGAIYELSELVRVSKARTAAELIEERIRYAQGRISDAGYSDDRSTMAYYSNIADVLEDLLAEVKRLDA